jgi:U3 small nucleolar ribonucleoprotein protein LCP5
MEKDFKIDEKDETKFLSYLKDLKEKIEEVKSKLKPLEKKIEDEDFELSKGISFLDVKYNVMLSYIINLSYYFMLKLNGQKIENHPVIEQLIKERTILEKMKPLELKLKYQIDKLVKMANGSISSELQDPLQFKPNPKNMINSEDEEDQKDKDSEETKLYRPPKIVPMHFEEKPISRNIGELSKREQRRAAKSRLLRDLQEQYDSRPEELTAAGTGYGLHEVATKMDEKLLEKQRYEEENFMRFTLTREEKKARKRMNKRRGVMSLQEEFNNLGDFRDLEGLNNTVNEEDEANYGSGILRKRKMNAKRYVGEENVSHKKGRFKDVDDLVDTLGRQNRKKGKFATALKRKIKHGSK